MKKLTRIDWTKTRANGKVIGNIELTRSKLETIKKTEHPQFLNTYSHSGAIIALRNGYYAIGMSNINQAGRGFILCETELLELCKKLEMAIKNV